MELEWLKKNLPFSLESRQAMIEIDHPQLSIRRQCDLIDLHRGTFYYTPAGEPPLNLALMRQIDEEYTRHPFYGSPKMTIYLQRRGYAINHKRVERLMQKMGLRAVCPSPQTSQPRKEHKVYPYRLRGLTIDHPLQVFSSDITYIRMQQGFMYLVAVLDWFSRYLGNCPTRWTPISACKRCTRRYR